VVTPRDQDIFRTFPPRPDLKLLILFPYGSPYYLVFISSFYTFPVSAAPSTGLGSPDGVGFCVFSSTPFLVAVPPVPFSPILTIRSRGSTLPARRNLLFRNNLPASVPPYSSFQEALYIPSD